MLQAEIRGCSLLSLSFLRSALTVTSSSIAPFAYCSPLSFLLPALSSSLVTSSILCLHRRTIARSNSTVTMKYLLAADYAWRQQYQRPWEQRNDPIMVGDLPLKRQNFLLPLLNFENPPPQPTAENRWVHNPNHGTAHDLENLQVLLHLEGQETEAVILEGRSRSYWYDDRRVPFHAAIQGNWEQFAKAQANNQLEDFTISDMTLPPAPFFQNHLAPILQNGTLMRLDLINCNLGSSEFFSIADVLKKVPTLTSLCLKKSKITLTDASVLGAAIRKHKGLSFVDLSYCGMGKCVDILSPILNGCKRLNGLDLSGNEFGSKSLALIAKFLSGHRNITLLNMGKNVFDDESLEALNKAVQKNKTLEQLCLASANNASTNMTLSTEVQRSLAFNDKLMHIDLSGNALQANAVKLIAKHLKGNPSLSILTLVGCSLPNKSAEGLCNALKRNTNLAHLVLSSNCFNHRSVPFFVNALRNNSTLLTLDISSNNIKMGGKTELIRGALCDPTSFQTIAESNHTCQVWLNCGNNGNRLTQENEFRNINALDNEGQKIRYKVIAALFTLETITFNPRDFQNIPLELMPRLLELVQQELGCGKYGREVWKAPIRAKGSNPCLTRVYEVVHGWTMLPSLFAVSYYSSSCFISSSRHNLLTN
jgi:Ran GTPase-activating protein (RanGAP) involved in mRNA processing and transport